MNEKTALSKKKVAVISGSRAEAGLLFGLMHTIKKHPLLQLQVFITGMHLSDKYGSTKQEFEQQNIPITDEIHLDLDSSEIYPADVVNSMAIGQGIIHFSKSFHTHKPDLVLVLGDRFEIFAAIQAAMMLNIPIAHLHGGELSLGVIDDRIRHAITKISQLHFPVSELYAKRIIQMGESPARVFNVGATAIDNINNINLLHKNKLEQSLALKLEKKLFLLTWHPETVGQTNIVENLQSLLSAIEQFPQYQVIITKANADAGGILINEFLEQYVKGKQNYHLFSSLGNQRYLSLLQYTQVVLGNSSSALFEVAAMRVPSVNIGHRQDGRFKPLSVIDSPSNMADIVKAINKANSPVHQNKCKQMVLPYGDGNSCDKIVDIIAKSNLPDLIHKKFFDIKFNF